MVDIAPLSDKDLPHFFRMTFKSPKTTSKELSFLLKEIKASAAAADLE